jgi:hypothetical protein
MMKKGYKKGSMRGTGSVPKNKFRNMPQRSKRR